MKLDAPEWAEEAACRGTDEALWFPTYVHTSSDTYERARAICDACPVSDECLATALAAPTQGDAGIWAGTTPAQRREMRDPDDIVWEEDMPRTIRRSSPK